MQKRKELLVVTGDSFDAEVTKMSKWRLFQ